MLQGAQVDLQPPVVLSILTNTQGDFTVIGVTPGTYKLTITYIGFSPFTKDITVTAYQTTRADAQLEVASKAEEILVTAERVHGEAEAINRERTAENILQVLPAEVITSLPNANVADAIGRLPSVTLERDEGEGKYVQIRGTEPRFSNVTIDGVNVPAPESGVRQIKLYVIPSDIVESVEINKTLLANMDGDGIGGSVNLRTKAAGEQPTVSLFGLGGYTPILNGELPRRPAGPSVNASVRTKSSAFFSVARTTGTAAESTTSNRPRPPSNATRVTAEVLERTPFTIRLTTPWT